jgi:hypothetical protein
VPAPAITLDDNTATGTGRFVLNRALILLICHNAELMRSLPPEARATLAVQIHDAAALARQLYPGGEDRLDKILRELKLTERSN